MQMYDDFQGFPLQKCMIWFCSYNIGEVFLTSKFTSQLLTQHSATAPEPENDEFPKAPESPLPRGAPIFR